MKDLLPLLLIPLAAGFRRNDFAAAAPVSNNMTDHHMMSDAMPSDDMMPHTMPPTGMAPNGVTPTGMTPNGMTPNGMTPNGMTPTGMTPTGMTPNGMTPNGMTPNGMTPNGMTPNGMTPNGMTPNGRYQLPPLPYDYDALEPYIDEETMRVHHDGHHRKYVDELNKALSKYPRLFNLTLEELLRNPNRLPSDIAEDVVNNGGGHYNHTFFWQIMSPEGGGRPDGNLSAAINRTFGSFDSFKNTFKETALDLFGSGWTWLLKDDSGNLRLATTRNQNTPIPLGFRPIIALDVWEHAYYLKHQNDRGAYIDDWFNVVDWDQAEELYNM